MKIIVLFFLAAALLGSVVGPIGCNPRDSGTTDLGKVNVVASFYPLFEAALKVGGEKASVSSLVPAGTEPHDFEPTPKEIASLSKARIIVYNGAGLEAWMDRILPDLQKAGIVVVNASQSTQLLQMRDENDPSKTVSDPHIWLDPVIMGQIVNVIKDTYVQVDAANKAYYEANAAAYAAQLEALNQKYQATLAKYRRRTILTSHDSFRYLSRRYGLESIYIAGLSPEAEPSPQQLAVITKLAKGRGIKYIFFETLVSPRLAETVAQEVGAQTLVLNPLEGLTNQEIESGKSYITVMEENLANLKTALDAEQ